jgi:hypothetical protein
LDVHLGVTMSSPTSAFFDRLAERGTEPGLARTTGSVRFDLTRDGTAEHWRVDFRRGATAVSHATGPADCVVRADAALFDDLARGRANAMAAMLRGQLLIEGAPELLIRFQRLFPAPTEPPKRASARTVGKRRG